MCDYLSCNSTVGEPFCHWKPLGLIDYWVNMFVFYWAVW